MSYSQTLRDIAPELARHRHGYELLRILAEHERGEDEPDGWATAEAIYYVGSLWHEGQGCPLYAALCATQLEPGPNWRRPEEPYPTVELLRQLRGRS